MKASIDDVMERNPLRAFQIFTVAAVVVVLLIDGLDIQLLSLMAPTIITDWGVNRADFGPALAAALLGMSVGSGVGGWIGDRAGRLKTLVCSTLLFGAATALAGQTDNVAAMAIIRLVSGLGFGAAGPNGLALASEWLPPRARAQMVSVLSCGTPAGGMLGATIVLLLLPTAGWRGTFLICGFATLVFAALLALTLRESPGYLQAKGAGEKAQRALRAIEEVEADSILAATDKAPSIEDSNGITRLSDPRLMRLNLGVGVAFFTAALIVYGMMSWTPIILTDAGFNLASAVSAIFALNLGSVIAAVGTGFLVRLFGSKTVLIASGTALLAGALSLALMLGSVHGTPSPFQEVGAICLVAWIGAGAGAAIAAVFAMMAAGYPLPCRAAGFGFGLMVGRAGGVVLSFAGGYLLNTTERSVCPFFLLLAVSATMSGLSAFISDRHASARR